MTQTQVIIAVFTVLFGGGLGGTVVALVMLPKQRKQMDATTTKTFVDAASVLMDQMQEDSKDAKEEARAAKQEAVEARREVSRLREEIAVLWKEVTQLTADLADRDRTIARLRRVQ